MKKCILKVAKRLAQIKRGRISKSVVNVHYGFRNEGVYSHINMDLRKGLACLDMRKIEDNGCVLHLKINKDGDFLFLIETMTKYPGATHQDILEDWISSGRKY